MFNEQDQLYIEKAILASILLGNKIPEEILANMLSSSKNRVIFEALQELQKTSVPDLSILNSYLVEKNLLGEAGGKAYIAELTNLLASSNNMEYYTTQLTDSYYRRSIHKSLTVIQEELVQGKPLGDVLEQLPQDIQRVLATWNKKKNQFTSGISFNDLLAKSFPLAVWIVENLITQGLTLINGSSKIGKSWLALQLVIAIDQGNCFLGNLTAQKMKVVYFALEDTEERIKRRLTRYGTTIFDDAWLETTWPHTPAYLRNFLQEKPQYKVIIIDTLQQFSHITDLNDYAGTVNTLSILKQIASEFGIAIIAIHHTRKGSEKGGGDWMDSGLGSIGINATADCTITLTRKRDSCDGFLRATGRDIEEIYWSLKWNKELCSWSMLGDVPKEKLLSVEQQEILQILEDEAPNSIPTAKIAEKAGKSVGNTINLLNRLVASGFATKPERGSWKLFNSLIIFS